jgi:preprotein translocase subunit SecF
MNKLKKATVVVMILIIAALVIQVVVAETMGIDITGLLQQKTNTMADNTTSTVKSQLDQVKQETENETIGYLERYINDIKTGLEEYNLQETELAKQKIKNKGEEIKSSLDSQKQGLLDSSKIKIKAKIDSDLNNTLKELDSELSIKIQEKLK